MAMLQRDPFQKLHHDEGPAILLADFMNRADVGMIEGGSGLRLALKTGQRLRVFGNFVGQKLQGDEAMQAEVLGLVNNAHPATTEFVDNAVVRDRLADHWRKMLRPGGKSKGAESWDDNAVLFAISAAWS
jgi:hypothetical protein